MKLVYSLGKIDQAAEWVLTGAGDGRVISFSGDMGAGKTTLIQAICSQLKVKGAFGSPTFSIINEYESAAGPVYHIDLYRCSDEEEARRAGVEECLYSGHYCFVEWPSKAPGIFPDDRFRLYIRGITDDTRELSTENEES